jgi:hypothetical protein
VANIKRQYLLSLVIVVVAVAIYWYYTATDYAPQNTPNTKKSGSQTPSINLALYYIKYTGNDAYLVREIHQVPYTDNAPGTAISELINGTPKTEGAVRVLPPGTRLLDIKTYDGEATVNFSPEVLAANVGSAGEALGIQSIVNTLTEFPQIRKVSFRVEGKLDSRTRDWWGHVGLDSQPFKRNLDRVYEPAIWLTHPVADQVAGVPLLIKGSARVFEGTVHARLLDADGNELTGGFTTASEGAPGRGDFEMKLTFNPPKKGKGTLEVFWVNPKDGSARDTVSIPIQWP